MRSFTRSAGTPSTSASTRRSSSRTIFWSRTSSCDQHQMQSSAVDHFSRLRVQALPRRGQCHRDPCRAPPSPGPTCVPCRGEVMTTHDSGDLNRLGPSGPTIQDAAAASAGEVGVDRASALTGENVLEFFDTSSPVNNAPAPSSAGGSLQRSAAAVSPPPPKPPNPGRPATAMPRCWAANLSQNSGHGRTRYPVRPR